MIFLQVLRQVLENQKLFLEVAPALNSKRVQDPFEKILVSEVIYYYNRYRRAPTLLELNICFQERHPKYARDFQQFQLIPVDDKCSSLFLKDKFIQCVQFKGLENLLINTARQASVLGNEITSPERMSSLWTELKDLISSTSTNRLGISAHEDIVATIEKARHSAVYNRVSTTHWDLFDLVLRGGVGKEELTLYVAPSGRGKTTFLVNMAYLMSFEKSNILCFTTELKDAVFTNRLYRQICQISREDFIRTDPKEMERTVRRFFEITGSKIHVVYHKPNSCTPMDILAAVEQFENQYGEKVDVLILDYLDKLKIAKNEMMRMHLQDATEECRSIALEKSLAFLTATQANREAMKTGKTVGSNIGEGIGKHQSSDVVLTMIQTEDEMHLGTFKLRFDKVRELAVPKNQMLYMKFNKHTFEVEQDINRTLTAWREHNFSDYWLYTKQHQPQVDLNAVTGTLAR